MVRWPVSVTGHQAEVRYRLRTKGIELHPLLKAASRAFPHVTFALVSQSLQGNAFGAFTIRDGKLRGGWLGDEWRQPFWERAASEYNVALEDVFDDPALAAAAETWMIHAAMTLATGARREYDWSGGRRYRGG